ncbi:homoprotocatechuate degradation operon regulator HpaR [Phreatobacter stygius]|uniref:Homoprotocatechuate degradation operon regulator HpaR n=2 Tax=Phreatobacter stygius TaxID=1940610 RepID=A0A4D7B5Y0_9HYPH|nr:homoprotocatechuate degradation operon regulator HpaR [Phreatobacter stygius]QCI69329.1 homoprotocatechuate degradation operon regulator HpaR [Phreatobacter stygius]
MSLLRSREAVMRHFRVTLRGHDITEQQWRVLRALSSVGEVEINDLVRSTFLLAPSLSRILRDLEARQLIIRRTPASDLRRSLISIAPAGLALIEIVGPHSEAIYAEITRRYGAEKLALLQDMLRDLEREMTAFAPLDSALDDIQL